ncbi:MAG: hypothetical protein ACQEWW_19825 [Bacillota bacterium]|jgi:hypothetical protein
MDNSFIEKDNAKAKRFNQKDADVYSQGYNLKDDNVDGLSSATAKSSAKISKNRSDTLIAE